MKKILNLLTILSMALVSKAQVVTLTPSSFTAEDQLTITVDVTGTGMAGATEAYLWLWGDVVGDSPLNTAWTNSPAAAQMTTAGTNKWKFTFTATTLWGRPPADFKNFRFLVKKKDGSAQISDQGPYNFDPLVFTPTMMRIFPAKVNSDDMVTLNFDKAYGVTTDEQRMTPTTVTITMYDDLNNMVGSALTVAVNHTATTIWAKSFIPSLTFTPATGRKLTKFKYKFNGTLLNSSGATVTVSSTESEITFTPML